ncbi:Hypothetical protein, predicted lipoprotein [Metamycoplasma auris 15026]|uniref:Lipoprotein n=1 Tax=Metamycoplasma auris 15026 TaxID=1188233 RepID=N9V9V7_9BACT|nr:hypothetical protein [Metamycoplasma auris]ENY68483.1 Hypothetical protein, predicted lipoprotein [Metamycoplasma auris 15026]
MHKKLTKLLISLSSLSAIFPVFLISCQKNNFNPNKFHYIEKNNFANDYKDFSYLEDNFVSKNIQNINLATSSKLIRIKSEKNPSIDFRDNIVLFPSELSYKFEFANTIVIDGKEFSSDKTDIVSYETQNSKEKKGIFRPKKDKGNGFNSPFLFIPSSEPNSINSLTFKEALGSAKSIKIKVASIKDIWVDYQGKKIKNNNILNANSFKLNLLAKMLKNKDYRNLIINKNNSKLSDAFKNQNENLDGFNLFKYLEDNNINLEKLFDFSNENEIVLESKNNKKIDFISLFENVFILQNYFDGMPYEWLKNQYQLNDFKDFKSNLDWFFTYGKTYLNRFYAAPYFINKMDNNETILKLNEDYYKDFSSSILKQISIQYNPLPLANTTFSLQSTNAFKQNIISKLEYENLNLNEKQEILKNFNNYNFSYQKNNNRFKLNNTIIINHKPNSNSRYFNKNFLALYYGWNENEKKYSLKKDNLIFQSLFNNLINPYGIVDGNNDAWLSQAPENLYIDAKNKSLNVVELKDIYNQILKPIIIDSKTKKFNETFQFQNKEKIRDPKNITNKNKLQSVWFDDIKKELSAMIENFYKTNKNEENIYVNIPILIHNENEITLQKISNIKDILKSIHAKLKVDITLINDFEKYNEFFKSNNSIYKEFSFRIFEGNVSEYLSNQLTNEKSNLKSLIFLIEKNKDLQQIYKELAKLNNSLLKDARELRIYLKNLNVESQLNLINEINNLLSYTINFQSQINVDNFSKVIYQKHLIKPIGWNDLNYFQDIKIKEDI